MKVIFVGFKVKQDRAVMYKKLEETPEHLIDAICCGKQLIRAINKGCDFVSIRFIREEQE